MIEASRTTASTGATWAIVIVAVICLSLWLILVLLAAARPGRAADRRRIEAKQVAERGQIATGSDTTGPDTTGSDTAATRDDMYPVPGPRRGEAEPVATAPLAWAA